MEDRKSKKTNQRSNRDMKKSIITATIFLTLGSCSKQYHFERFIEKGGKIEPKIEWKTVTKTDTIKGKDGRDSVIYCYDSIPYAVYETKYVPKWQIKFDNKRFEDSLKHIRLMCRDSLKNAVKSQKIESKTEIKSKKIESKVPFWYWVGLIGSVLVSVLLLVRWVLPR